MQTYSFVLQMPGNKADAVPCDRLRKLNSMDLTTAAQKDARCLPVIPATAAQLCPEAGCFPPEIESRQGGPFELFGLLKRKRSEVLYRHGLCDEYGYTGMTSGDGQGYSRVDPFRSPQ